MSTITHEALMSHVLTELKDSAEVIEIMNACEVEFGELSKLYQKWLDNLYPITAGIEGIKKWEEFLNITPDSRETLEERRQEIIAKLNETIPYTYIQLHKMVARICGWGNFELKLDHYILTCHLNTQSNFQYKLIYKMFSRVVPMNILFRVRRLFRENPELYVGSIKRSRRKHSYLTDDVGASVLYSAGIINTRKVITIPEDTDEYIGSTMITKKVVVFESEGN